MRRSLLASSFALALVLAGCSASPEPERAPVPSTQPQVHALVAGADARRLGWAVVSNGADALEVALIVNPGYEIETASACGSGEAFPWVAPALCPETKTLPSGAKTAAFSVPFAELAADPASLCDASAFLQLSASVRETATGAFHGDAYAGAFKARVAYAVPCDPEPVYRGCARDAYAWAEGDAVWPVESLPLGRADYDAAALRALLKSAPFADASVFLGREVIAARLNVAAGAEAPAEVAHALDAADAWLLENRDADGFLPYGVKTTDGALANPDAWDAGMNLAAVLERFNAGARGPGRCD